MLEPHPRPAQWAGICIGKQPFPLGEIGTQEVVLFEMVRGDRDGDNNSSNSNG